MKQSNSYLTRAMAHSDKRYEKVLRNLGYTSEAGVVAKAVEYDLTELRDQYQSLLGKKPFHGWDDEELQRRIDEALE